MTAHSLLKAATITERKHPRYIFRRRCLMTADSSILQIRTLDVSEQGFGIVASQPIKIGTICSLALNGVVGDRVVQHTFLCEAVYCILAGVDGFRIGLHIPQSSTELQKRQIKKIIANCSPSFV